MQSALMTPGEVKFSAPPRPRRSLNEARRIAVNIAKLPERLTRPEPESTLAQLRFEFFQFPIAAHPS
jgi:hypothetical protein